MSRQNFRTYNISLTAGQDFNLNVNGEMYAVIESAAEFTITFDESNRITKAIAGTGGRFRDNYSKVTLNSTTTQTVTLVLGFGQYNDSRSSVNATINTTIAPSDTVINSGDVTAGASASLLAAANPDRKEIEICLPSTATNPVRIGNSSVTASSGSILEVGSSKVFGCEAALYVIRTGAVDETVTVLELERA